MNGNAALNPTQLHLLRLFSFAKNEESLNEIKMALTAYFAQKVEEDMDALWEKGEITLDTIEQWGKEHMRTPYK